jgi:YegS/Rv2252/BmrU family lipid kinase
MCALAVVNPAAGGGRVRRRWPTLAPRLRGAVPDLTVRWTTAPGEATALTRSAVRSGTEHIVAVGGDGTLHEVVNGFFAADGTPLTPAPVLTPLPCGTGSDFCRALGTPTALEAVARLSTPRSRRVDLLRVHYTDPSGARALRYGLNVVSFGLSARVVERLGRRSRGAFAGRLSYLGALLRTLTSHRPFAAHLTVDDAPLPGGALHLGAIANGPSFGAGLRIAPGAQLDDGRLDVTVLHDASALSLLCRLPRFYRGTHPALDGVTTAPGRRVAATPRALPVPLEADGEWLGRLPATVEVVPGALRLRY